MRIFSRISLFLITVVTVVTLGSPSNVNDIIDHLATTSKSRISDKKLANKPLIIRAYTQNNYQYLWPNAYINEVINILKSSQDDGLLKKDYHYFKLLELTHLYNRKGSDSQKIRSEMDILLTDGILSYQFHLMNGKVSPENLYKHWNYLDVKDSAPNILAKLRKSIKNQSLKEDTFALRPQFKWYRNLQRELKRYEQLALKFPSDNIPYHKIIHPGENDSSIPKIAKKLDNLNLINVAQSNNSTRYTTQLSQGVKKFQSLNGLKSDGVLGPDTIRFMNIPYRERANQIKANLERARWIADDLTDNYLLINIAGYKLTYFHDNQKEWTSEVIVGQQGHKTPVFTSKLRYIEYNPTWTVPKSMLPPIVQHAKNSSSYLKQRGYVVKTANGSTVDPSSINWQSVDPQHFKYWLVQQPSDFNSLGRVKFMFPNAHAIYLHDTPGKQLFALTNRSFSHGCIRLNHPFNLSLMLLENDQGLTESRQNEIRSSGKRTQVSLKHPIDVFVMYWTASPEKDGLHFYKDVYHRDNELITLLNTPFDELLASEKKTYHASIR